MDKLKPIRRCNLILLFALIFIFFCPLADGVNWNSRKLCDWDGLMRCQDCKNEENKCFCNSTQLDTELHCKDGKLTYFDARNGEPLCPPMGSKKLNISSCDNGTEGFQFRKEFCDTLADEWIEKLKEITIHAHLDHKGNRSNATLCPIDLNKCHPCKSSNEQCFCPSLNETIEIACNPVGNFLNLFDGKTGGPLCPKYKIINQSECFVENSTITGRLELCEPYFLAKSKTTENTEKATSSPDSTTVTERTIAQSTTTSFEISTKNTLGTQKTSPMRESTTLMSTKITAQSSTSGNEANFAGSTFTFSTSFETSTITEQVTDETEISSTPVAETKDDSKIMSDWQQIITFGKYILMVVVILVALICLCVEAAKRRKSSGVRKSIEPLREDLWISRPQNPQQEEIEMIQNVGYVAFNAKNERSANRQEPIYHTIQEK
ncbi:uncharacterized protein LOC132193883 [Neocloeon triangulifer]|uniref:uncharacterized protein LOC132193883 n=1 Tax=Neocloeon triangulifer TaxID=2078957 RepID=UPI00286EB859|nr:uncharacterized protein LOC132193883 [Neocloeon triangulifer]